MSAGYDRTRGGSAIEPIPLHQESTPEGTRYYHVHPRSASAEPREIEPGSLPVEVVRFSTIWHGYQCPVCGYIVEHGDGRQRERSGRQE